MPVQDQTQSSVDLTDVSVIDSIIRSADAVLAPSPLSNVPRIPRVPERVREKHDYYEKHYVPKLVSIGPYHFGNPKLQSFEKLKPGFAMSLFDNDKDALTALYEKLAEPEMVRDLRSFYDQESLTNEQHSDKVFTKIMLLDGCFIFFYIAYCCGWWIEGVGLEFNRNKIFSIQRDLYLLENQIPFKVLKEVMKLAKSKLLLHESQEYYVNDLLEFIKLFIRMSSFVKGEKPKRKWLDRFKKIGGFNEASGKKDDKEEPDHLLGAIHGEHSTKTNAPTYQYRFFSSVNGSNIYSANELSEGGIGFKPIEDTLSMTNIEFAKRWWGLSANVKLPPVVVSEYTRPMLLNMVAYETCRCSPSDSWVTMYVYLLASLIDKPKDVKILRKAWVIYNALPSDQEVVALFKEIATDLHEDAGFGYLKAKREIQWYYESRRNTLFSELRNEYVKSPWAFLGLLGALIALFLTAVQTYYTVWSPESPCDELCKFLKINHHL